MIKFLGTLHMKKLDLKYEPRLRRAAFIEWNRSDSKMTDLLIYTVAYAFMDKATRMSTINYKKSRFKTPKSSTHEMRFC